MSMRALILALLFGSFGAAHAQQPAAIDDLLKSIRESSTQNAKINQER